LLAFVDADQELAPGWLTAAADLLDPPSVWAAGADYHAPADGTWVQRVYDRFRNHTVGPVPVDWLPSGNLVVRRTAFDRIGGFDTSLESCEDVDFCRRIREAGGTLVESAALKSIHHGDPRTLRALFLSELWRGRDNLRVSLRERLTLRSAPSVLIPVAYLMGLAVFIAGLVLSLAGGGFTLAASGAVIALGLTTLRALRLSWRAVPGEGRLTVLSRAWLVAATYDAARALALVTRASHDMRRKG
jgi:GT2 family glycosyltransferase